MTAPSVIDVYRLTPLQEGILFHHLMEPDAGYYVDQLAVVLDFDEEVDPTRIEETFAELVARHDVLRTGFIWEEQANPLQLVADRVRMEFAWEDWSALDGQAAADARQTLIASQRAMGFDLPRPPLLRVAAARLPGGSAQLIVTYHHIILDAWSVALLFGEFRAIWRGESLPAPVSRFRDYVRTLSGRVRDDAQTFWQEALRGVAGGTLLVAGDPPRTAEVGDQGEVRLLLSVADTELLRSAAKQMAITLASLVHAAWARVLALRSGTADVMFGCTFAGRPANLPGSGQIAGLCINTLPLRIEAARGGLAVNDWLRLVHMNLAAVRAQEFTPLSKVREWSGLASGTALFDCVMAFENAPGLDGSDSDAAAPAPRDGTYLFRTNYAVNLLIVPGEQLSIRCNFDASRFRRVEIERCLREFAAVALRLAAHPQAPLSSISLLDPENESALRPLWFGPDAPAFGSEPVHLAVARNAARAPAAIAISDGERDWTYEWLSAQTNRLAAEFRRRGVGLEDKVAVHMHRSANLAAVMLALFQVGAAYVPLDPMYPSARLQRMIESARPVLALCDRDLAGSFPASSCPVLFMDQELPDAADSPVVAQPGACAYVIFTSGSSGLPKGIELTHEGLSNMLADWNRLFAMDETARLLHFASISFDASVWEILSALVAGGTLCIASRQTLYSADDLLGALTRFGVTHALLPPSLLGSLDPGDLPDLRCIAGIGERCTGDIARRWSQGRRFYNAYGPAEGTITDCVYEYQPDDGHDGDPPIGWPMANVELYVLDFEGSVLPPGVPGELAIGGVNVARGYIGHPGNTAAKFVPNPHGKPGSRLYLSGDRVIASADGALTYLGRADDQVKIRGTRIETGEVEQAIRQHPGVKDTLVMARDWPGGDEKRLVAYLVASDPAAPLSTADMRAFLRERLAEVMIPSAYVPLGEFPVSVNGKIDRKALPEPDWQRDEGSAQFRSATSELEGRLVQMWSRVLRLEKVGVDDNYFDLGGDSIISIRLVAAAQRVGIALTPREIFEHQTIARLAAALEPQYEPGGAAAEHSSYVGPVVPLPMQSRFINWMDGPAAHYNQAVLLSLDPDFTEAQVRKALQQLVDRHDALRLLVAQRPDGGWQFEVQPKKTWSGLNISAPDADFDRDLAAVHAALDPKTGQVFTALWQPATDGLGSSKLLLAAHHLAVDALSWTLLLADLAFGLDDEAEGVGAYSFAAAAQAIATAVQSGALDGLAAGWRNRLGSAAPAFAELADLRAGGAFAESVVQFSPRTSALLRALLPQQANLGDVVLAALSLAGGGGDLIDLESDGRTMPEIGAPPASAVGWFTAIAPFQLPSGEGTLTELAAQISEARQSWEASSYSFGALHAAGHFADGKPRTTLVNWLGDLAGRLPVDAPFRLSKGDVGVARSPDLPRPYAIELNAWLDQDSLVLSWGHHGTDTSNALIHAVRRILEAVEWVPAEQAEPEPAGTPSKRDRLMAALRAGGDPQ